MSRQLRHSGFLIPSGFWLLISGFALTASSSFAQSPADPVRDALRSLAPSPDRDRRIAALILALGGADHAGREEAARQLADLRAFALPALREAVDSDEPELAARAKAVLRLVDVNPAPAGLRESLAAIRRRKLTGLAPDLLVVAPLCVNESLRVAAVAAVESSATPADAPAFRAALSHASPVTRTLAVVGLGKLGDAAAIADSLDDPDEQVRLTAATTLARLDDRSALPALVSLLSAADVRIRYAAGRTLAAVTGHAVPFVAAAPPDDRARAVAAWQTYLARNAATLRLRPPPDTARLELGRTLLCIYSTKELVELDENGKVRWKVDGFQYNWGCQGLSNGHRLVADQSTRTIYEYDQNGVECWRAENVPGNPVSVERLEDGNTLVAASSANIVYELDLSGKVVWEARADGFPSCARRLDNGNTLVTLRHKGRVIEIDAHGNEVWRAGEFNAPYTAQRLENGNTVVCEMQTDRVVEVDPAGKTVWRLDNTTIPLKEHHLSNPAEAQRLANGNTLVGDERGAREFTPQGKVVWQSEPKLRCRVSRF